VSWTGRCHYQARQGPRRLLKKTRQAFIEMKVLFRIALFVQMVGAVCTPVKAAEVTEAELMAAATELARQYDAHYAAKDSAGISALYAEDGMLVSPGGPIIRGRVGLTAYYSKRFASGFKGHATKVLEVYVRGDGGYGLSEFTVSTPAANGQVLQVHGTIVSIYQHDPDGWHFSLVVHSIPARRRTVLDLSSEFSERQHPKTSSFLDSNS
jgi:ketosteroid isomerase-like protein